MIEMFVADEVDWYTIGVMIELLIHIVDDAEPLSKLIVALGLTTTVPVAVPGLHPPDVVTV
jgi:hypothetical protein